MNVLLLVALLAQVVVPTPPSIATTPPSTISESAVLDTVVANSVARARAFDGTLGVVIMDLGTGTQASRNADRALPMQSVQKLPIAVLIYLAIDKGALSADRAVTVEEADLVHHVSAIADNYARRQTYSVGDLLDGMLETSDNTAAKSLLRLLGGVSKANAALATLGYGGITLDPDDNGSATAHDLARFLQTVNAPGFLSTASQKRLLDQLANATTFPSRLRAGFPPKTRVMHKTGTSYTVDGITDATNDIGIISLGKRTMIIVALLQGSRGDSRLRDGIIAGVARGAYNAALQFPMY